MTRAYMVDGAVLAYLGRRGSLWSLHEWRRMTNPALPAWDGAPVESREAMETLIRTVAARDGVSAEDAALYVRGRVGEEEWAAGGYGKTPTTRPVRE